MSITQCICFVLDYSIYINWKIVIFNSLSNCQIYIAILFYIVHNILQMIFYIYFTVHNTCLCIYSLNTNFFVTSFFFGAIVFLTTYFFITSMCN